MDLLHEIRRFLYKITLFLSETKHLLSKTIDFLYKHRFLPIYRPK